MTPAQHLKTHGWVVLKPDPGLRVWAQAALAAGAAVLADPQMRAQWLTCAGTWFVGVDALPNAADGSLGNVPLAGPLLDLLGPLPPLHAAQLSVTWPGYPQPRDGEGPAAFRYRQNRDAAHVDGLIPVGPDRQRQVQEPHAWILGIPLTRASAGASPLVVYSGSHIPMQRAFASALAGLDAAAQAAADLTEVYAATRRAVFDTCPRVTLQPPPGSAILLHRHCLHGIAPWAPEARSAREGRQIAYFRPQLANVSDWMGPDLLPRGPFRPVTPFSR